jgi:hypothetical protein
VAAASISSASAAGQSAAEGLPEWPTGGNIRVLEAKPLAPEEAEAIYRDLLDELIEGYRRSGLNELDYRGWQRLSPFPHASDEHGMRFVNVYLNQAAAAFATASSAAPLPAGAVVAKDSFSVIRSGAVSRGPLFLMEKMPAGFWPEAGDWRYSLIMPNGWVFGRSKGTGNAAVQFCADCHQKAAAHDYLFAVPEAASAKEP